MKLRLNPPIPHPVNLKLKAQASRLNNHLKSEIQIIKLNPSGGRQTRKQTLRHSAEISRQCTNIDQIARVC